MKFKLIKTTNRKNKNVISQIRKRSTQKKERSCDLNSSALTKGNFHLKLIKQEVEAQDFKTQMANRWTGLMSGGKQLLRSILYNSLPEFSLS